jgi:imidazolonepropionase
MKLIGPFTQLITMRGLSPKGALGNDEMEVIVDGGILLNNGVIVEVGSFEALRSKATEIEHIATSQVAMPGWIDCHTHMLWGGSRAGDFEKRNSGVSYQQILEQGGGIFDTVRKTTLASDKELKDAFEGRLKKQLRNGVTTVEVKSGYGLTGPSEMRMLSLINEVAQQSSQTIVPTFLGAHVCPIDYTKEEYLTFLSTEIFPKIIEQSLSKRVDIFIEQEAFRPDLAYEYLLKAKKSGFDLTVHANQFSSGGAFLAAKLGAKSADHLEHIEADEIRALADSDTVAVALPGASLGLGAPMTPARALLDAGAALAIATDWNPGSAPMGNLLAQTSIIAASQKLSTAEVFTAVTSRAAKALGLTGYGQLEVGYRADIVTFPTGDHRDILYHMGGMTAASVYLAGQKVN